MKSCNKCPHSVENNPDNAGKEFEDTPCLTCSSVEKPNTRFVHYSESVYYDHQDDPWGVKKYD